MTENEGILLIMIVALFIVVVLSGFRWIKLNYKVAKLTIENAFLNKKIESFKEIGTIDNEHIDTLNNLKKVSNYIDRSIDIQRSIAELVKLNLVKLELIKNKDGNTE
jgi:hypothetical protein